ncbi:MAG: glycosyltransferase family 1 protein, partial [Solirubrobacterales bacterium]|nr:glycosyltransferase family 1 protein [Solirubrobacterales bacterium]
MPQDHARAIRVASVPAGHVYVRHLAAPSGDDGVRRLPDLADTTSPKALHGWYPPAMLAPSWVSTHGATFDVFHVHFGFDGRTPAELTALADALEAAGVPLVVTVHDLRNPHHVEPGLHDAQLEVLVRRAAAVITLTPGAARTITERSGRAVHV